MGLTFMRMSQDMLWMRLKPLIFILKRTFLSSRLSSSGSV